MKRFRPAKILHLRIVVHWIKDEMFHGAKYSRNPLASRFCTRWIVPGAQKYTTCGSLFKDEMFHGATYSEFSGSRSPPALNCSRSAKYFPFQDRFSQMNFSRRARRISTWELLFTREAHHVFLLRNVFQRDELFQAHQIFHLRIVIQRRIFSGTPPNSNCKSFSSRWNVSNKPHICTWGPSMRDELFQAHRLFHLRIAFKDDEFFQASTTSFHLRIVFQSDQLFQACDTYFHLRIVFHAWIVSGAQNIPMGLLAIVGVDSFFNAMNCSRRTKYSTSLIQEWATWLSFFKPMNYSERTKYSNLIIMNGPFGYRFSNRWIVPGAQNILMGHLAIVFQADELFQAHKIFQSWMGYLAIVFQTDELFQAHKIFQWAIWLSFFKPMNCSRRAKYSNHEWAVWLSLF